MRADIRVRLHLRQQRRSAMIKRVCILYFDVVITREFPGSVFYCDKLSPFFFSTFVLRCVYLELGGAPRFGRNWFQRFCTLPPTLALVQFAPPQLPATRSCHHFESRGMELIASCVVLHSCFLLSAGMYWRASSRHRTYHQSIASTTPYHCFRV